MAVFAIFWPVLPSYWSLVDQVDLLMGICVQGPAEGRFCHFFGPCGLAIGPKWPK